MEKHTLWKEKQVQLRSVQHQTKLSVEKNEKDLNEKKKIIWIHSPDIDEECPLMNDCKTIARGHSMRASNENR